LTLCAAVRLKEKVGEAAMEMQQRFHATLSDWDDITRMQYQSERNGRVVEETVKFMKSFSKMNLVEGELDGELQVPATRPTCARGAVTHSPSQIIIETEFQRVMDQLQDKVDEARSLNDSIKTVFNAVQGTNVNAFNFLCQNTTFRDMINDEDALDGAMSYRVRTHTSRLCAGGLILLR
jgi:hypothetical protein